MKKKLSVEKKVSVFCFSIFINWEVVNKKKLILKIAYVIILMTSSKSKILILTIFQQMKNHTKIFWFMTFHTKLYEV